MPEEDQGPGQRLASGQKCFGSGWNSEVYLESGWEVDTECRLRLEIVPLMGSGWESDTDSGIGIGWLLVF